MATSSSSNFTESRDTIIQRALRICSAIADGDTPTTTQYSNAAQALNDIVKALQADGLQLWHRTTINFTPAATTASYAIGTGATINQVAPLKVYQAWYRDNTTNQDTPMILMTKQEYDLLSNKAMTSSAGTPNIVFYDPPGATTGEMQGTIYLYVMPDSTFASNKKVYLTVQQPIQDFDASTDNPDFPSYWYECIVWMLARDLAYEHGVPLAERSMIAKMAEEEHMRALSFDQEEGSFYIQPDWRFRGEYN